MTMASRLGRSGIIAAVWVMLAASAAHAHGGLAGPDELGPPVIISTLLGIGCYWLMVLWPSRRRSVVNKKRKTIRSVTK